MHHTSSSCDDLGCHVHELNDEPRTGRTHAHMMHEQPPSQHRVDKSMSFELRMGLAEGQWATNYPQWTLETQPRFQDGQGSDNGECGPRGAGRTGRTLKP